MHKKLLFLAGAAFAATTTSAQSSSPSVIASAGDISPTNTGSLAWTLGEPVIETATANAHLLTQGFHQPLLHVGLSAAMAGRVHTFEVSILPNPVQATCKTLIRRQSTTPLYLELSDIQGRRLYTTVSTAKTDVIDLDFTPYTAGTYVLTLRDAKGGTFQTFKIIKAH